MLRLDLFVVLFFFFFFKQKTAYEITYGDWSSDVCSSDLCWTSSTAVCEEGGARVTGPLDHRRDDLVREALIEDRSGGAAHRHALEDEVAREARDVRLAHHLEAAVRERRDRAARDVEAELPPGRGAEVRREMERDIPSGKEVGEGVACGIVRNGERGLRALNHLAGRTPCGPALDDDGKKGRVPRSRGAPTERDEGPRRSSRPAVWPSRCRVGSGRRARRKARERRAGGLAREPPGSRPPRLRSLPLPPRQWRSSGVPRVTRSGPGCAARSRAARSRPGRPSPRSPHGV